MEPVEVQKHQTEVSENSVSEACSLLLLLVSLYKKKMAALLRKTSGHRGTLQQNTGTMGPHVKDLLCIFSSLEKSF